MPEGKENKQTHKAITMPLSIGTQRGRLVIFRPMEKEHFSVQKYLIDIYEEARSVNVKTVLLEGEVTTIPEFQYICTCLQEMGLQLHLYLNVRSPEEYAGYFPILQKYPGWVSLHMEGGIFFAPYAQEVFLNEPQMGNLFPNHPAPVLVRVKGDNALPWILQHPDTTNMYVGW